MQRVILSVLLLGFLVGCGDIGNSDGKKGPTSTGSRVGLSSYGGDRYEARKVDIQALSYITTNGTALDIALSDDAMVAYVASGEGGLEVIDISIPEYPRLVHSYDLPEYVNYVEIKDGRVYVANMLQKQAQYFKLYAFDTYNPYEPAYLGYDNGSNGVGHSRVKKGTYLYEVGQEGLQIHKENDSVYYPAGSYYLHGTSYAVAVHKNYIFIANGRDGVRVLKTDVTEYVGRVH